MAKTCHYNEMSGIKVNSQDDDDDNVAGGERSFCILIILSFLNIKFYINFNLNIFLFFIIF